MLSDEDGLQFQKNFNLVLQNILRVMKGKQDEVAQALIALFAEGHLLIEDVPGTGKTTLAKAIARSIGGSFSRLQFTPDLLPADVTGGLIFSRANDTMEVHLGPIFANIVLVDEVNRASPKTQSALLEVMQENQVTIGDTSHAVPRPFVVIATQNPIEQEGTYRLPEAQLDRFMVRMGVGYPDRSAEVEVVGAALEGVAPEHLDTVMSIDIVGDMIAAGRQVNVTPEIQGYAVDIAAKTRDMTQLKLGVSPRGTIAIVRVAQVLALARAGRIYVTADDINLAARYVMPHRLIAKRGFTDGDVNVVSLVEDAIKSSKVPAPARGTE